MVKTQTIIAVADVQKSSKFYQSLLGCKSAHGGDIFEILTSNENVILCLHKWGEHKHPTMMAPENGSANGLILYFRVDNLLHSLDKAKKINAHIEKEIHYNNNSLKNQFILRDLDNYYLIISE